MRGETLPEDHFECLVAGGIEANGSIGYGSGGGFFRVVMAVADGEGHGRIIMGNVLSDDINEHCFIAASGWAGRA